MSNTVHRSETLTFFTTNCVNYGFLLPRFWRKNSIKMSSTLHKLIRRKKLLGKAFLVFPQCALIPVLSLNFWHYLFQQNSTLVLFVASELESVLNFFTFFEFFFLEFLLAISSNCKQNRKQKTKLRAHATDLSLSVSSKQNSQNCQKQKVRVKLFWT